MKQFAILFKCGFLSLSKYIQASIVNIFNAIIFIFVQYFVWRAICENTNYTFMQMLSYIVYAKILSSCYPSSISSKLASQIKNGNICFSMLRPISISKQLIFEELGKCAYKFLFISVPILIFGLLLSRFQIEFHSFQKFITVFILSASLFVCIDLIFGTMAFYTTSTWGINSLKAVIISLLSGKLLPLDVYPENLRNVLNFLPFKYLYSEPIKIILGISIENFIQVITVEFLWLIILYSVFKFFYSVAIRRVTILGG